MNHWVADSRFVLRHKTEQSLMHLSMTWQNLFSTIFFFFGIVWCLCVLNLLHCLRYIVVGGQALRRCAVFLLSPEYILKTWQCLGGTHIFLTWHAVYLQRVFFSLVCTWDTCFISVWKYSVQYIKIVSVCEPQQYTLPWLWSLEERGDMLIF